MFSKNAKIESSFSGKIKSSCHVKHYRVFWRTTNSHDICKAKHISNQTIYPRIISLSKPAMVIKLILLIDMKLVNFPALMLMDRISVIKSITAGCMYTEYRSCENLQDDFRAFPKKISRTTVGSAY